MRDHFIGTNMYYKDVFDILAKEKVVLDWSVLSRTRISILPNVNLSWIASHIWSFTGRYMTDIIRPPNYPRKVRN